MTPGNFMLAVVIATLAFVFIQRQTRDPGPAPFCRECVSDYGFGKGCQYRGCCVTYKAWRRGQTGRPNDG